MADRVPSMGQLRGASAHRQRRPRQGGLRISPGAGGTLPDVHDHLDAARADILAFTSLPTEVWTQIWSNPHRAAEQRDPAAHRLGRDLPHRDAIIRLVGAVLAEQTDQWAEGRRYLGVDILTRCSMTIITTEPEIGADTMPALTANHRITRQCRYTTPRDLTQVLAGYLLYAAPRLHRSKAGR